MEKQTAVEWLFEQLWETPKDKLNWHTILKKAKEMEKTNHGKTWDGALDAGQNRAWNVMRAYCDFDDYYEKTYENK
jgi:hypothetical protein